MSEPRLPWHAFGNDSDIVAVGGEGTKTFGQLRADVAAVAAHVPGAEGGEGGSVLIVCSDRYRFAVALLAAWSNSAVAVLAHTQQNAARAELGAALGVNLCLHDGDAQGLDLRELLAVAAGDNGSRSSALPGDNGSRSSALPGDNGSRSSALPGDNGSRSSALPGDNGSRASALPDAQNDALPGALSQSQRVVTLSTSGSTGAPVFVDKTARQLIGEARALAATFARAEGGVVSTVPPRHIYGLLFGVLWPWQHGMPFVRETPLLPEAVIELARRFGARSLVAVPAHLSGLVAAQSIDMSALSQVFSSGAPLPRDTFVALRERGLTTTEVLGSTETGGFAYRREPQAPFTPFDAVKIDVDADGTLALRSQYLESDARYVTRDRVQLLPDGRFLHLGRSDDVVKVGGTRVSLSAIEERTRALPGVREAAAVSVDVGGARGVEVWLVVASEDQLAWDAARLRKALGEWLDPLALPRRYRFVAALPRDATGKLPRAALLALFASAAPTESAAEPVLEPPARRDFDVHSSDLRITDKGAELTVALRVPPELVYFQGHFEGDPILPGVVQLHVLAAGEARKAWPELGAPREVRRLKFTRPIRPSDELVLSLSRAERSVRVDFKIAAGDQACASGTLLFGAQPAGTP